MEIRNSKALKKHNKSIILNEIIENQPISRSDLTKKLDVSHATISYIVKDLLEQGLIVETEFSESTGGRPSRLLEFKGDNKYIIAVEIGSDEILYSLFNLNMERNKKESFNINNKKPKEILDKLFICVINDLEKLEIEYSKIIGVGISISGIFDEKRDLLYDSITNKWDHTSLKEELYNRFKLPIHIGNDANLAAHYEWAYGVGVNYSNLIYIHLSNGIGSGIIINNQLYKGVHGNAGEIGHVKVKATGKKCDCGSVGCLETVASIEVIREKVNQSINNGEKSVLGEFHKPPYNFEDIIRAYNYNDFLCIDIVEDAVKYIISALSSVINMFDIELIILGGAFSYFNDQISNKIYQELNKVCFNNIIENLHIVKSSTNVYIPLCAAAAFVFDKWKNKI